MVEMDRIQAVLSVLAAISAVLYPLYALLKKERSLAGVYLLLALGFTSFVEVCDLLALLHPERTAFWKKCTIFGESLLPATWFLFTSVYAREGGARSLAFRQRITLGISFLLVLIPAFAPVHAIFYSPDLSQEKMLFLGTWGFYFYLALLTFFITCLVNLEVTLVTASRASRWNIKYEVLGTGALLAALIFYYSQGLLYRTINMSLMPVRTLAILAAVLFIAYAQLRRREVVRIRVSRTLAYKSLVILGVGIYLVGLGLMGEGLKYFGASFQKSLVVALAFIIGLVFLTALFSETVKRKIKVFLYKNFYQNKYDYRLQWLQFTDRLSHFHTGEELYGGILSAYCETFGMGCGCLYLAEHETDKFVPTAGMELTEPMDRIFADQNSMIGFLRESKWVLNVEEGIPGKACEDIDFLRIRNFTFVIPLFAREMLEGFILLGRPLNRNESYNFEDYDLMKTLARQTCSAITNLRLSDQLVQAREMEAIGKISAFVIHDLKNLVYTLSLMTDNAKDYIADPEFQHDMLESLDNTIGKMRVLIDKLKYLPEKNVLQKEPTNLLEMAREAAAMVPVEILVTGEPVSACLDREEMQKVVLNLLINAVDAMGGEGPVTVAVGDDGRAYIRVTDSGTGIPADVMPSLFRPFTTTKKKGLGIGLYQCKQIVEAHDGKIEVDTEVGAGTTFTVRL